MSAALLVMLGTLEVVCFFYVCYSAAGPWGWSIKARALYGISGICIVGVLHMLWYSGVKNPNAPGEDPIRNFKQGNRIYKKWARLNSTLRFRLILENILLWGALVIIGVSIYRLWPTVPGMIVTAAVFGMGIPIVKGILLRS